MSPGGLFPPFQAPGGVKFICSTDPLTQAADSVCKEAKQKNKTTTTRKTPKAGQRAGPKSPRSRREQDTGRSPDEVGWGQLVGFLDQRGVEGAAGILQNALTRSSCVFQHARPQRAGLGRNTGSRPPSPAVAPASYRPTGRSTALLPPKRAQSTVIVATTTPPRPRNGLTQ